MLFLFLYVVAHVSAAPEKIVYSQDDGLKLFDEFIKEYNKQYDNEERSERLKIFLDNLKEINDLNEKSSHATFGITRFTDLTKEEFTKLYTGYKFENNSLWKEFKSTDLPKAFNSTVPDEFDWRSKKVVSRVKDQGNCGSCWAFGTTDPPLRDRPNHRLLNFHTAGNVESVNAIKSGKIVEISEQQLIDCDKLAGGCSGGDLNSPFQYLVSKGAMSSESYPYEAEEGKCNYDSEDVVIKIKKYEQFKVDEEAMKKKLFSTGPLTIGLAGAPLQSYKKGILVSECGDSQVNHAVLLVGYGKEKDVPFWIIKNSWSTAFGEDGYFRIKRGVDCLKLTSSGVTTAIM